MHVEIYLKAPSMPGSAFTVGVNALPVARLRLAKAPNGRAVVYYDSGSPMGNAAPLQTYEEYDAVAVRWSESAGDPPLIRMDVDDLAAAEAARANEGG